MASLARHLLSSAQQALLQRIHSSRPVDFGNITIGYRGGAAVVAEFSRKVKLIDYDQPRDELLKLMDDLPSGTITITKERGRYKMLTLTEPVSLEA